MKVKDVMAPKAVCCGAEANVGTAVELMWSYDCGLLPVVGPDNRLVGVVTDREYLHCDGNAKPPGRRPSCTRNRDEAGIYLRTG